MNRRDFDELLQSIRSEEPGSDVVREAASRVREKVLGAGEMHLESRRLESRRLESRIVSRLESCEDFRALRGMQLSDARRMLLEDHLHSCVACRRFFRGFSEGDEKLAVISNTPRRSLVTRLVPLAIAAAIVVTAGLTLPSLLDRTFSPSGARATVASVDGELYRVSETGAALLTTGAAIAEGDEVRTAKGSHAMLRLRDGSMVEMAERSDVRVSERFSGKTVTLDRGSVMVEAAKQRRGRLEILTPDVLVSVKGTIFSVSRGLKGSRVSVVEGEVKVDRNGATELLHRGDQTCTSESVARTSVAQDIAWSRNSAKYLALLSEFAVIEKKLDAIQGPGLRYKSNLVQVLPENTAIFASVPNLETTIAEASAIFEDRVKDSAVLSEWWNANESQALRQVMDHVRNVSSYLGDEVVLAIPAVDGRLKEPFVIAEAKRAGLKEYLEQQGLHTPVQMRGNLAVVGHTAAEVDQLMNKGGGFDTTPFWKRIEKSYHAGAGWLFAANMEQILPRNVNQSNNVTNDVTGLDNIRYLVIERKQNLGRTENSAALSFAGARTGLANWIAPPAPMGSLDFVSADASFAASFVVNKPDVLLEQLISLGGPAGIFENIRQETGIDITHDVAASLGGEVTASVDGPLLPTPSWKIALEVNNPARLEWSIEQAVKTAQERAPETQVKLESEPVSGLTYYTLTSAKSPVEVNYVFIDGYLLMGANRGLLETAIQNRQAGLTLTRSAKFRAQLPQDGHMNFSALLYYNMGAVAGPMVDQLKATGILTPEQQKSIDLLTSNREPTLIYAYAEPDRIFAASRGNLLGFGLDTLVGLNGKGSNRMFSHLFNPLMLPGKMAPGKQITIQ